MKNLIVKWQLVMPSGNKKVVVLENPTIEMMGIISKTFPTSYVLEYITK